MSRQQTSSRFPLPMGRHRLNEQVRLEDHISQVCIPCRRIPRILADLAAAALRLAEAIQTWNPHHDATVRSDTPPLRFGDEASRLVG